MTTDVKRKTTQEHREHVLRAFAEKPMLFDEYVVENDLEGYVPSLCGVFKELRDKRHLLAWTDEKRLTSKKRSATVQAITEAGRAYLADLGLDN